MHAPASSTIDLGFIASKLRTGECGPVSGGYSPVRRCIVVLADGSAVFAKQAVDAATAAALRKEYTLYKFLEGEGYPHAPRVLGYAEDTLILPDLRAWDWSPTWSQQKLDAVLGAMQALGRLKPSAEIAPLLQPTVPLELEKCWHRLVSDESWTAVRNILQANSLTPRSLLDLSKSERQEISKQVAAKHFECSELTHCDIRADNCAYHPVTQQVQIVDWNWAELNSFALDRSAFLVSVLRELYHASPSQPPSAGLSTEKIEALIDSRSALALAGFWLYYAAQPPIQPGDPRGLRTLQLESGLLAWRMAESKGRIWA